LGLRIGRLSKSLCLKNR